VEGRAYTRTVDGRTSVRQMWRKNVRQMWRTDVWDALY